MRIAPVSGDLLVKLTLVAVAVGVLAYGTRKAVQAVQSVNPIGTVRDVLYGTADYFGNVWDSGVINPASTNNAIYTGINDVFWPDQSESLGTWLYGVFNPDPMAAWNAPQATQADVRRIDNATMLGSHINLDPWRLRAGI